MEVTFQFYKELYQGSMITEKDWNKLEIRAESRLSRYTFGRLESPWPEPAKYALCEMAEILYQYAKRGGKVSENNDGYSVSYDTSRTLGETLYQVAYDYLAHTGAMDLEVGEG